MAIPSPDRRLRPVHTRSPGHSCIAADGVTPAALLQMPRRYRPPTTDTLPSHGLSPRALSTTPGAGAHETSIPPPLAFLLSFEKKPPPPPPLCSRRLFAVRPSLSTTIELGPHPRQCTSPTHVVLGARVVQTLDTSGAPPGDQETSRTQQKRPRGLWKLLATLKKKEEDRRCACDEAFLGFYGLFAWVPRGMVHGCSTTNSRAWCTRCARAVHQLPHCCAALRDRMNAAVDGTQQPLPPRPLPQPA